MLQKKTVTILIIVSLSPLTTLAQKNFFEVPSGEHVETHEFFAQTQATATRDDLNAMAAVTYGRMAQIFIYNMRPLSAY